MDYSFSCPIEGCGTTMHTTANTRAEAVDKLSDEAKNHLQIAHSGVVKTDEQIRSDVENGMVEGGNSQV